MLKLLQSSKYKHIEPAKVCALSAETVVSKPPIIFQTLYQRSQEKGAFTITFSQNIYPTTEHILYYERYILLQNRSPITKDISYYKTNPLIQKVYPITKQIPLLQEIYPTTRDTSYYRTALYHKISPHYKISVIDKSGISAKLIYSVPHCTIGRDRLSLLI